MQASEKVFDRIGQTINLFKNGFFYITLPFFLYSFIPFILFTILPFLLLKMGIIGNLIGNLGYFFPIFHLLVYLLSIIFSLIIYIPFFIFTIKTINDLYIGKNVINVKGNISFSISRFFSIFKTYWYIFAYVALIPTLIYIFGGVIYILGFFSGLGIVLHSLGGLFIALGGIVFIIFSIIRGIRTIFSLYSAIEKDEFTKENFNKSIELTTNKWWRILGNIILVVFIFWVILFIISLIVGLLFSGTGFLFQPIFGGLDLNSSYSIFFLIFGIFNGIIKTIGTTFILVFGFLLYKRFELEFLNPNLEETNEEVIEIEELVENNKNNEL